MRLFTYTRPSSVEEAATAMLGIRKAVSPASTASTAFLTGGTTLLDLMKLEVLQPENVVDLGALAVNFNHIGVDGDVLRIGAFTRMSDAARHPIILEDYPVIAQSLALAASAQIRNMASLAGNVLQRTRCAYFRDPSWTACNKRIPGSGCAALEGVNRAHAVLGTSHHCIATYHGDFAQALVALGAEIVLVGPKRRRQIPFETLHQLPDETPHLETSLQPGEIIVEFLIPAFVWARRSLYLKIRDRQSYEYAVASAAVALDIDDGAVRDVRIALGGLATVPWRSEVAEAALRGHTFDAETAREAARQAFADAQAQNHNGFKIALGQSTLVRALMQAAAMEIEQ